MGCKFIFKRQEIKYFITKNQKEEIMDEIFLHLKEDEYGRFNVCNVYFDTPDYIIARRSIDKPIYKEKLRIRSYGQVNNNEQVFLELKKKYDSTVYKRRIQLSCQDAFDFISSKNCFNRNNQIEQEIKYFCLLYRNLQPSVFLSYNREAYYDKNNPDLRLTFDDDILWRDDDFDFDKHFYGQKMINDNCTLLEIKTDSAVPLWLSHALNSNKVYPASYSKYGNAYKLKIGKGDKRYAG